MEWQSGSWSMGLSKEEWFFLIGGTLVVLITASVMLYIVD